MGKRLKDPMEKIAQKSVGFPLRQHLFFAENPDFKPDEFCRMAVDEQVKLIDPKFLNTEERLLNGSFPYDDKTKGGNDEKKIIA